MAQIAVDGKGNKLRWDESKKQWVPVEKAVNDKGEAIEFDGIKWNPIAKPAAPAATPKPKDFIDRMAENPFAALTTEGVNPATQKPTIGKIGEAALGGVEGLASAVSGALAFPISALTSFANVPFAGPDKAKLQGEAVARALTYVPNTQAGKDVAGVLSAPFALVGKAQEKIGELLPENMRSSFNIGTSTLLAIAPFIKGMKATTPLTEVRRAVYKNTIADIKTKKVALSEVTKAEATGAKTISDVMAEPTAKKSATGGLDAAEAWLAKKKQVELAEEKAAANANIPEWDRMRAETTASLEEQGASLLGEPRGGSMLPTMELPKRVGPINLERLDIGESAQKLVADMEDMLHQSRVKSGRQKVSWSESEEISNSMGGAYEIGQVLGKTAEEVIADTKKSTKYLAEKIEAQRTLFKTAALEAQQKAKACMENPTPEGEAAAQMAYNRWALVQYETGQASGEISRALNIHKKLARSKDFILTKNYARVLKELGHDKLTPEAMELLATFSESDPLPAMKFLAQAKKATTKDKLFEVWINSLLSNPSTHLVNLSSNILFEASSPMERLAGAGVEFVKHPIKTSAREIYFGEAAHSIVGAFHGIREGLNRYAYAMKHGQTKSGISKFEAPRQAIKGTTGEIVRIPTKELMASDDMMKAVIYSDDIYAMAYRQATKEGLRGDLRKAKMAELIANPTESMKETATKTALTRTFQSELGKLGKDFMRARSRNALLEFIFPFVRTPANIVKEGVRRTPLGLAEALKPELTKAERSMIIGRGIISYSMAALVAKGILEGVITGSAPDTKAERDRLYNTGWRPYSFKIGDTYYSYGRIEPFATYVGVMADASTIFDKMEKGEWSKLAAKIGTAFRQNITNKTFLTGMTDVINATTDPGRYGEMVVRRWLTSLVPASGALGATAKAIDPEIKDARKVIDWYRSRLPFLSRQVTAKTNVMGEVQKTGGSALERLVSPVAKSREVNDPVYTELDRLKINLSAQQPVINGKKLSAEDAQKLMTEAGPEIKKAVLALIISPIYKTQTDENKRKMVLSQIGKTRAYQKGLFILRMK
jgi:hypothetical protein